MKGKSGIFPEASDIRCFVDVTLISVFGNIRSKMGPAAANLRSFAIWSLEGLYARAISAIHSHTGNPLQLRYGPTRWFRRVPSARLQLRSEERPLTMAECESVLDAVMEPGYRILVSFVELTWDIHDIDIDDAFRYAFTTARRFRELKDEYGWKTKYLGSPTSPWQVRMYQKAADVLRIELVLRRSFLKAHGIESLADVERLRSMDLSKKLRFRELSRERLRPDLLRRNIGWKSDTLLNWQHSEQELERILRDECRIPTDDLLEDWPLEDLFRAMQRNLIW